MKRKRGPGRPKLPKREKRVIGSYRIKPETAEEIEDIRNATGRTAGQIVDDAVCALVVLKAEWSRKP